MNAASPADRRGDPIPAPDLKTFKVLVLSRYERNGASSRVRFLQFAPYIEAEGARLYVAPLLDSEYLSSLYAGRRHIGEVARSYLQRLKLLRGRAASFDLLWLEKEALPWIPGLIESGFMPKGIPIVSDFDDAVFHHYDLHASPAVRRLLGRKVAGVMSRSALVMAGNDYLAAYASAAGARCIQIVPTVVDIDVYTPQTTQERITPVIGWIGSPSTFPFVEKIGSLLEGVALGAKSQTLIVGAGPQRNFGSPYTFRAWSEDREVADIQSMDIGIMPLPDTPWARGKCGYKLIQYMACGLPVVASPVGVNTQIVEHGVNGFLAETDEEWEAALTTLIHDPDLRRRMGREGRRKVEAEYSLQVHGPRVARLLCEVAERGRN